ncbi:hypothetical protein B853_19709 [Vibrio rotiferianus CAIM 577 = LMG 21460]|nr:hypothetical protein [Vibrio rotiferianus]PIB13062.1 hypothetical protein B853_19709 [Vibrio rotiferianus CAIM 577 = LMG 21460]
MLDKLKTFSIKLSPIQPLFLLIALGGFAVFLTTLFKLSDMVKESYLIPSGVAALWALSAWVIISTFQHVPEITPSSAFSNGQKLALSACSFISSLWVLLGYLDLFCLSH